MSLWIFVDEERRSSSDHHATDPTSDITSTVSFGSLYAMVRKLPLATMVRLVDARLVRNRLTSSMHSCFPKRSNKSWAARTGPVGLRVNKVIRLAGLAEPFTSCPCKSGSRLLFSWIPSICSNVYPMPVSPRRKLLADGAHKASRNAGIPCSAMSAFIAASSLKIKRSLWSLNIIIDR